VTRVPSLRKWFIRAFMLLLVLAAYGGTAVVAEATGSECETFVFHEISETRRQSASPKRHRERRREIDRDHVQPDFRNHGRLWFVDEHFQLHEAFGPPPPSRAPPPLSDN